MQIVRSSEELARSLPGLKRGGSLALVPTMGALHAGHMALIEEGQRRADRIAASIFVNPMQFGANEDFGSYPRQPGEDARMLENAGCDLLWLPAVSDIYPEDFATRVSVTGVSKRWEGEIRPGHFDGVATIVARLRGAGAILLGITNMPDFASSDTTRSTAFGRTGNAYDVRFSPGGSSGGRQMRTPASSATGTTARRKYSCAAQSWSVLMLPGSATGAARRMVASS